MPSEVMIAIIAFGGTLAGTFGGIMTANKLTNYRIQQLEKKVEKHNSVMERTFVLEEKLKVADHRIEDLETERKGE